MSEPLASSEVPLAREAPEPPLDPPTATSGFHGLRVMPQSFECVYPVHENSGVVVLAWTTAPASMIRSGTGAVCSAISSIASEPYRIRHPATGISSLIATGRPSSGRTSSAAAYRRSESLAAASASSVRRSVNAFTVGSTWSARAETDASSSTGESSFVRMRATASVAVSSQGSVTR